MFDYSSPMTGQFTNQAGSSVNNYGQAAPIPNTPSSQYTPQAPSEPQPGGNAIQQSSVGPQMNREQWRDAWMSQGQMPYQQAMNWLNQNGAQQLSGNGTFRTPFGDTLDLMGNARGAAAGNGLVSANWTQVPNAGSQMAMGAPGAQSGFQAMPALQQLIQQIMGGGSGQMGMGYLQGGGAQPNVKGPSNMAGFLNQNGLGMYQR